MGRPPKIDLLELENLLDEGRTKTSIAKQMNVSPCAISWAAKKIGHSGLTMPRGSNHGNWTGGRYKTPHGYIRVYSPNHPRADSHGYVAEHIMIWEKANGIRLPESWCVHHKNGIKDDNDPDNLVAYPRQEHSNLIPSLMQKIISLEKENKILKRSTLKK